MAAKLARRNRRKVQAVLTYLQSLPDDQLVAPIQETDAETLRMFAFVTRFSAWLMGFQFVYFLAALICMVALCFPLIETDYTRRCNEHQASFQHLLGPTNFTKSCSMTSDDQPHGFVGESYLTFFAKLCCSTIACMGSCPVLFWLMIPCMKDMHRLLLLSNFQRMFISMVGLSIIYQLASAFITRPLVMLFDLRIHSALVMQLFGIGLCLLAAFICGVRYASNAFLGNRGRRLQ